MNSFLEERKKLVYFILVILFLLLVLLFVRFILPLKEEQAAKKAEVNRLEREIGALKDRLAEPEEGSAENEEQLKKRIPDRRAIDQLLLSVQEAEYASNSQVNSISFTNYDGEPASGETETAPSPGGGDAESGGKTEEGGAAQSDGSAGAEETAESPEEGTAEPADGPASLPDKPENLKTITFTVDVVSPDFDSLLKFVKELEKLERIHTIDTVSFSLPGEKERLTEEEAETVSAKIQATTFYYQP